MTPRTEAERLVATALADALRGELRLTAMDLARLALAAKQVPSERIAGLALRQWVATDARARDVLRMALLFATDVHRHGQPMDETVRRR